MSVIARIAHVSSQLLHVFFCLRLHIRHVRHDRLRELRLLFFFFVVISKGVVHIEWVFFLLLLTVPGRLGWKVLVWRSVRVGICDVVWNERLLLDCILLGWGLLINRRVLIVRLMSRGDLMVHLLGWGVDVLVRKLVLWGLILDWKMRLLSLVRVLVAWLVRSCIKLAKVKFLTLGLWHKN